LKKDGRRRTAAEKLLMQHVARAFAEKKKRLGARKAAKQLGVSLASFYKYVAEEDLPRMAVLSKAQKLWGIKWPMMDPSEILRLRKVRSVEQLAFSFLEAVREADVEIVKIDLTRKGILQVKLKIYLPDSRVKPSVAGT
jgi:predicted DNA-binding transcriptional regulator AlpA